MGQPKVCERLEEDTHAFAQTRTERSHFSSSPDASGSASGAGAAMTGKMAAAMATKTVENFIIERGL